MGDKYGVKTVEFFSLKIIISIPSHIDQTNGVIMMTKEGFTKLYTFPDGRGGVCVESL